MVTSTQVRDSQDLRRLIECPADDTLELFEVPSEIGSAEPIELPDQQTQSEALEVAEVVTHRLEDLPKELGVLLTSVGVLGFILPGIAGTPALIAGGLVLWPKTFGRVEDWFQGRFPIAHRTSMQQVGRFIDDLERRYPLKDMSGS